MEGHSIYKEFQIDPGFVLGSHAGRLGVSWSPLKNQVKIPCSSKVHKVIDVGCGDIPGIRRMAAELVSFTNSLGNPHLQQHLIALPTPDLATAV